MHVKNDVSYIITSNWQAQAIGEAGSKFIHEDMDMDYIYDYMFHLLNEYAKLQRFKPTIPPNAVEYCPETMTCGVDGTQKRFMEDSLVKSPSDSNPCTLPPPYEPINLQDFLEKKANSTRQRIKKGDNYSIVWMKILSCFLFISWDKLNGLFSFYSCIPLSPQYTHTCR